jgi:hypothetical protein
VVLGTTSATDADADADVAPTALVCDDPAGLTPGGVVRGVEASSVGAVVLVEESVGFVGVGLSPVVVDVEEGLDDADRRV